MMKPKRFYRLLAAAAGAAMLLAGAGRARADIVTYVDGRIVKGIIEEGPGNPGSVVLTTEMGRITIPKERIKSIQKESRAQGLVNIGKGKLDKGAHADAISYFQQALTLEPDNATAKQLLAQAEGAQADQQRSDRSQALGQVDKLASEARALIQKGDFAQAEKILMEANKLMPSNDQKKKLAIIISDMYMAWAEDRADKLDQIGAEEKLQLALAANRENEQVIEKMLKLWENDPQKRQYSARVYETILERHPEDRALELKLANLYHEMGRAEDAVRHYLNLFKASDEYRGSQVELRLMDALDRLHRQYAIKKQYDQALHYFDILAALAPQRANPTEKLYYLFYQKAQGIKADDVKSRLELARFAEQSGLEQDALMQYRSLIQVKGLKPEITKEINAAITRYATRAVQTAQMVFDKGDYTMAKTLADSARRDFPEVPAIQEKVAEIVGKAQAEEAKERRNRRELARAALTRADEFFNTGYFHYQNLFSTERRNIPLLGSDRAFARQYMQLAVNAYLEVLRIDPTMGSDAQSLVNVKLGQAREILSRLNLRPAPLSNDLPRQFIVDDDSELIP